LFEDIIIKIVVYYLKISKLYISCNRLFEMYIAFNSRSKFYDYK